MLDPENVKGKTKASKKACTPILVILRSEDK
jgi:hypothetical protein